MDLRSAFSAIAAPAIGLALVAAGSVKPAQALLTYNIFETTDGNVVVETDGFLNLPQPSIALGRCVNDGFIFSADALICTGPSPDTNVPVYSITGPDSIDGSVVARASSVSGISTAFNGTSGGLFIPQDYVSGSPIISSATFNNTTLKGLGFTTTGLIGTWTLTGTDQQIRVVLTEVPGPLPLVSAGAAFAFSRKLRRRIAASPATPLQA